MIQYVLLGICIVILICLIYWVFFKDIDEANRLRAKNLLLRSSGIFDTHARHALRTIERVTRPNPTDYYTRGNIAYHNILEGDLRANRGVAINILNNYTAAVNGMRHNHNPINRRIIDDVENIYTRTTNNMPINTNINAGINTQIQYNIWDHVTQEEIALNIALMALGATINENANPVRVDVINDRIKRAKNNSNNKVETINNAFDDATVYSNNPQNVHDSKINSDLRVVLSKFKASALDFCPNKCMSEIIDYINSDNRDEFIIRNRENALKGVYKAEEAIYISTYEETEKNILAYTWERCKHKRNKENEMLMKDAVITSLIDGIENSTQVCINGRCSRILNSLATLDYDYDVASGALTLEAYRNQIYQEVKIIVNNAIDAAFNSSDPEMKDVGESYNNGDNSQYKAAEELFKNNIRNEIDLNLQSYAEKLTNTDIEKIKYECYTYALLE